MIGAKIVKNVPFAEKQELKNMIGVRIVKNVLNVVLLAKNNMTGRKIVLSVLCAVNLANYSIVGMAVSVPSVEKKENIFGILLMMKVNVSYVVKCQLI